MMEISNQDLQALNSILGMTDSPHVSYHLDGQAMKTLFESKIILIRLRDKLIKYQQENSATFGPSVESKPLKESNKKDNKDIKNASK